MLLQVRIKRMATVSTKFQAVIAVVEAEAVVMASSVVVAAAVEVSVEMESSGVAVVAGSVAVEREASSVVSSVAVAVAVAVEDHVVVLKESSVAPLRRTMAADGRLLQSTHEESCLLRLRLATALHTLLAWSACWRGVSSMALSGAWSDVKHGRG